MRSRGVVVRGLEPIHDVVGDNVGLVRGLLVVGPACGRIWDVRRLEAVLQVGSLEVVLAVRGESWPGLWPPLRQDQGVAGHRVGVPLSGRDVGGGSGPVVRPPGGGLVSRSSSG